MKKGVYTEKKAEDFLKKYIPVAKNILSKDVNQALKFSKKYPIALKIISDQALHKSDVGGVKIVNNKNELVKEYNNLLKIAKKNHFKLDGILVQEFIKGQQMIIGLKQDPTFGHVIMCGLGGVFVEILKDVTFRVCPITEQDADSMIDELKSKAILFGARGEKPVNIKEFKKALIKVSKIPLKHKNITELDINPIIVNHKSAKVVDARAVFS